jgi:hypothetical protein
VITTNNRIVAALNDGMKRLLPLIFAVNCAAHAQISTGTLIAFQIAHQKFVIAADSRSVSDNKPPEDDHCKISAFKSHRAIVAVSAVPFYAGGIADKMQGWDAVDEAKKTIVAEEQLEPTDALHAWIALLPLGATVCRPFGRI